MKKISLIISIFIFLILSKALNSTIWIIDQSGGGNFTIIQEGINASSHGDTVLAYPGRYYENVNFNGKNITLASLELITGDETYITTTIIDGNQQGSCIRLDNEENGVIIRGFSITNGTGDILYGDIERLGGGVLIFTHYQSTPINASIINCRIFYAGDFQKVKKMILVK